MLFVVTMKLITHFVGDIIHKDSIKRLVVPIINLLTLSVGDIDRAVFI